MHTPQQTVAALIATSVWADGEFSEIERFMADEIARSFGIPRDAFARLVSVSLGELDSLDEAGATDYLCRHASRVHPDERADVFMAMIQMVLSDGVLTTGEVQNLFTLGEALGFDSAVAAMMLCDMARSDSSLELSFDHV